MCPIWDFECKKCKTLTEYLTKDCEMEVICSTCKEKLIMKPFTSQVSFNFKGQTGWFKPGFSGYKP